MEKRFERRIILGLFALLITFLPLIAAAFFSIREMVGEQNRLVMKNMREVQFAEQLRHAYSVQLSTLPAYILSGDPALIEGFRKASLEFDDVLAKLTAIEDVPEAQVMLITIKHESQRLKAVAEPGIEMRMQGKTAKEVNAYFTGENQKLSGDLRGALDALVNEESRELESARIHVNKTIESIIRGLIATCLIVVMLALVIAGLIIKMLRQQRAHEEKQRELFENEKRISQSRKEIVEVVSHDLKNPLATVKMGVEFTLDELSDRGLKGEIADGLRIAHRSAESMERLIVDLLDHAKIEAGQLVLDSKTCSIDPLLEDLLSRYGSLSRLKGVKLIADVDKRLPKINCDLGRMEQALSNLLGNALKFTPAGGAITLSAHATQSELEISIHDSGRGMDESQLPHIFDRFWQVRETAKMGTGLGLSIVKSIVDAHGGHIEVTSEIGKGSTFTIRLALADAKLDSRATSSPL